MDETVPTPDHASDIEAMVAASGHTEADSILILNRLMKAGWVLRPLSKATVSIRDEKISEPPLIHPLIRKFLDGK